MDKAVEELADRVLFGVATAEERREYFSLLAKDNRLRDEYIDQMRVHALIQWDDAALQEMGKSLHASFWTGRTRRIAAAAAIVLLAAAAAVSFGIRNHAVREKQTLFSREAQLAVPVAAPVAVAKVERSARENVEQEPARAATTVVETPERAVETENVAAVVPPQVQGKEEKMKKTELVAVAAVAAFAATASPQRALAEAGTASSRSSSAPLGTDTALLAWSALDTSAPSTIRWAWPAGADSATLTIESKNGRFATNLTDMAVTSLSHAFAKPRDMMEETVYTLSMVFRKNGVETGNRLSAKLAAVRGVGQRTASRFITTADDKKWPAVKYHAVLPLLPAAETLVIDHRTNAVDGSFAWFAMTNITVGLHPVSLITPSCVYSNTLIRVQDGFVMMLK